MADITEVKRLLAARAQAVAEHLLPAGKREGHEWCVGSIDGEQGKSLKIHLSGHKAGIWRDFAGDGGGDLIDLWMLSRRLELTEALDQARAWLGVEKPTLHRPARPTYKRPPRPQGVVPKDRVHAYLVEDRNIPLDVLVRYRVGENGDRIIFPFILPDGVLALVKTRLAEDGDRPKPTAADCEPVLFGWQAMPPSERECVITEGEIDALSWAAYGYSALSVPFGGGNKEKQRWIESEFDRMARFERIYLATDMDEEGEKAAVEIANRLGRHRCLRVKMPRKDGNQCLVEGVPKAEIDQAIAEASYFDVVGLRRPSEYIGEVIALFWPSDDKRAGYTMPYGKAAGRIHFRPAELTLWTGETGAGKTQLLTDCIVDWVKQGSRICISSLEMKPAQTFRRMCKQVVGVDRPTHEAITEAMRWMDQGLIAYELTGKAKADELLDIFAYARSRYGCDQFVIDSLMRLGISSEAYDEQEKVIFRLVDWCIANNVHLHLVAHARKGSRDRGVPGAEDIKGAMEIGANAFNILSVWRNRSLEEEIRALPEATERAQKWREKPGVVLNIAKQRNGDYEGRLGLWFDDKTYRYGGSHDEATKREYLEPDWAKHQGELVA